MSPAAIMCILIGMRMMKKLCDPTSTKVSKGSKYDFYDCLRMLERIKISLTVNDCVFMHESLMAVENNLIFTCTCTSLNCMQHCIEKNITDDGFQQA